MKFITITFCCVMLIGCAIVPAKPAKYEDLGNMQFDCYNKKIQLDYLIRNRELNAGLTPSDETRRYNALVSGMIWKLRGTCQ